MPRAVQSSAPPTVPAAPPALQPVAPPTVPFTSCTNRPNTLLVGLAGGPQPSEAVQAVPAWHKAWASSLYLWHSVTQQTRPRGTLYPWRAPPDRAAHSKDAHDRLVAAAPRT